jgi:hypothetical protein
VADKFQPLEGTKSAVRGPLTDSAGVAHEEVPSDLSRSDDAVSANPGEDGDIAIGDPGATTVY